MQKLDQQTPNFTDEHIANIAAMFPHCVTEAEDEDGNLVKAIDFDLLKQELSRNIVEGPRERYRIDWPGKRASLVSANTPITKTLRPNREESVDFDTTQNLYIEGDNLEALKLLQESYLGTIKMIYIDPPYNTGKDFVYKDKYTRSEKEELEASGQVNEEGGRLVANLESNGRFHSDWLSMMYPRLRLARNLLKEDGVIVIHIDENEYPNLEKMLSEVFGETNNLGTVVWDKRNPKGDATGIAQQHELLSFYCKNRTVFKEKVDFQRPKENAEAMIAKASQLIKEEGGVNEKVRAKYKDWLRKQDFSGGEKAYSLLDDKGKIYQSVSMGWPNKKQAPDDYFVPLIHPITQKECPVPERGWRNPSKTMKALLEKDLILFGKDETTQPRRKYLLEENMYENVPSLLYYGGSDDALLSELGIWFDTPKVVNVSKKIMQPIASGSDIILDFFSGSATTAHAVMQLNAEDRGNRKYIMVQLPEEIDEKSEAYKAGYKTIAEIGKERIRRAGKKIKEENADKEGIEKLDIGFRVLKIDSSNMKEVYFTPDAVSKESLFDTIDHIKEDRTSEDLLFGVLVDWGVDLTLPIHKEEIMGRTVYTVGADALTACFDDHLDEAFIKELASREALRVVFKESGFKDDETKINTEQIFKQLSPGTDVRVV